MFLNYLTQFDRWQLSRKSAGRPFFIALLSMAVSYEASAQAIAATRDVSCRISGADSVRAGSTASYTIRPCPAGAWTVSCGSIVDHTDSTVLIHFTSACGITTIAAGGANKTVTVLAVPSLSAVNVQPAVQSLAVNHIPQMLHAGVAIGGLCDGAYRYQWYSSVDSIHFTAIPGAVGQDYRPGTLQATTWFQRQDSCILSGTVNSTVAVIRVHPSLSGVSISPGQQSINARGIVTALALGLPSQASGVRFQWQQASDGSFRDATPIAGATTSNYAPGLLDSTSYFRLMLISQGDTSYSQPAVVSVFAPLGGGKLEPESQTVSSDSIPLLLNCTGITGGSGNYRYAWFQSADGANWQPIAGVTTPGYCPGSIIGTTWFRVVVSCNGLSATSSTAVINLKTQP